MPCHAMPCYAPLTFTTLSLYHDNLGRRNPDAGTLNPNSGPSPPDMLMCQNLPLHPGTL